MPICGYLVTPRRGKKETLQKQLKNLPEVEVYPSDQHDLLVMVTETHSKEQDQELEHQLKSLHDIDCLALTFGANAS
jgi:nitrate reductase NapAB chaperone NapD